MGGSGRASARAALGLGVAVAALGAVALAGAGAGRAGWASLGLPGAAPAPGTGLGFVLLGGALALVQGGARRIGGALALLLVLLAAWRLLVLASGVPAVESLGGGTTAPETAAAFLVAGLGLLARTRVRLEGLRALLLSLASALVAALGIASLFGAAAGLGSVYAWSGGSGVSGATGLGLALAGTGLLLATRELAAGERSEPLRGLALAAGALVLVAWLGMWFALVRTEERSIDRALEARFIEAPAAAAHPPAAADPGLAPRTGPAGGPPRPELRSPTELRESVQSPLPAVTLLAGILTSLLFATSVQLGRTAARARRRLEQEMAGRRRIAAELRRSNAELEQFAYVASHDLQEPLRMVASYVQLLERRYAGKLGEDADTFIHYAADGARRMQQLISDLLAFSRAGRGEIPDTPHATGELVDAALGALAAALRDSDAQITREELPPVSGNRFQLVQVFQNLIGNAIKYRGEAPLRVHVGVEEAGPDRVGITVRDNGIGFDPEHARRIFEPFQRLHARGRYEGTGMGLALVERIVSRHGGEIRAESRPGEGTAFHLRLPRPRTKGHEGEEASEA